MTGVEITAMPFINREGRWTLVAKRGSLIVHVSTRARWEHYSIDGALTDAVLDDLARLLVDEFGSAADGLGALSKGDTK